MDKSSFWNKKILNWERKRYSSNSPIKHRVNNALFIVDKILNQKTTPTILEIGCGSGIFAEKLMEKYPEITYMGIDISEKAIACAKEKKIAKTNFYTMSVEEIPYFLKDKNIHFDCVISLGLLDWLNDKERIIIKNIKSNYFIHSFSAKYHLFSILHSLYVFFLYGYKNISYIPKYDSDKNINHLLGESSFIYKNKNMNIGRIATNIKLDKN